MSLLDKESVKRVEKILKEFDMTQKIIVLDTSARTALEAASSFLKELYVQGADLVQLDQIQL